MIYWRRHALAIDVRKRIHFAGCFPSTVSAAIRRGEEKVRQFEFKRASPLLPLPMAVAKHLIDREQTLERLLRAGELQKKI